MQANCEKSTTPRGETSGDRELAEQWRSTDWQKVENHVSRLQASISKAYAEGNVNLAKRKTYLLTHSHDARLLAVRRVTGNRGGRTPGVDGEIWATDAEKMRAVLSLDTKGYKPKPLRRIHIPKRSGKLRPLSIPTMKDRAMQTLFGMALDPIQEATADPNSYGFRVGRGCKEACERLFTLLSKGTSAQWVLDCDIRGCFDNISHLWLMENIPMDRRILGGFLKAGFVFEGELFPTENGTPQGGTISPILANMTLNGMEGQIESHFGKRSKVHVTRYADDLVVTCPTESDAEEAKRILSAFLAERGLELAEEKTRIVHISEGFDFLSYNFRKYDGKLLITPSKEAVKRFKDELSQTVRGAIAWTQDDLIIALNNKIRGWCRYHDITVHSKAFRDIDRHLFRILVVWARKRHPRKSWDFIANRYWHRRGNARWTFCTDERTLLRAGSFGRRKHIKFRADVNPYLDRDYVERRRKHMPPLPQNGRGVDFGASLVRGNPLAGFLEGRVPTLPLD